MNATDIFGALWKQKKVIALFLSVALLLCHFGLFAKQAYTASVYIKYIETNAVNGLTSNGEKLDPYEITDPYIIRKTLEQLEIEGKNANAIAQKIKVTPLISTSEQKKYASWIDAFSDYEKTEEKKPTPIYYRVDFQSKDGAQFAKKFLSALIYQYRNYYTEQYSGLCEVTLIPESVILNSDYYYSVELLKKEIESTISYLNTIKNGDIDYRSPKTGYSFGDLMNAYDLLLGTEISAVTQYILDTGVSKDSATLVASLQQSSNAAQRESDKSAAKANSQKQMMSLYATKNKDYSSTIVGLDENGTYLLSDVLVGQYYARELTAYDKLMLNYVDYAVESSNLLIDKSYIDTNMAKFGRDTSNIATPEEEITSIYEQYTNLVNITEQTLEGYNSYKSGKTILQVSGIQVTETMAEFFYYMVSGILALCLSCGLILMCELKKAKGNYAKE